MAQKHEADASPTSGDPAVRHPADHDDARMDGAHPPPVAYRAWSEKGRRWIDMTFPEHRAWLTRPDLDPMEFATGELAS